MKRINAFTYNTHSNHYYSKKQIPFRLFPHPDRPLTHDNTTCFSLEDPPPFRHFPTQSHHFHCCTQLPLWQLWVPWPLLALLLYHIRRNNPFLQAPITHSKNPRRPSSTKELIIGNLFPKRMNESFYKEKIFETWLINNTHLELIKILTRRRMVCQPASKYVPLMVR